MNALDAHAEQVGEDGNGEAAKAQILTEKHGAAIFAMPVNVVNRALAGRSQSWKCLVRGESCQSLDTMNRIRELRHARRLSLVETARLAGTTVQQLSRLELGERRLTVDWMQRIAVALGVRPADLLPQAGEQIGEFIQSGVERNLIRWWRTMSPADRGWLVARARDYGFRLDDGPRNQPKVRRA